MKKRNLLLTLILAVIMPLTMNAQGTLTIGNGTSYAVHNGNNGSPMGDTYYYYATTQSIYTASELGSARTITSVAFYHNAGYLMDATINIYLAHTTASTVDASNPATTGTLVYTGTNIVLGSSNAEWQVFDFSSTPFEYNGTDNLLVIVCRTKKTSGNNSSYNSSLGWQYTTTSDNKFMQRSSDSSGYDNLTSTSYSYTAYANRPNIQIGYTTTEPYINLDPTSETVKTGFSKTITATYGNVTNPTITYSSSDTSVATVSGNGTTATVTGVSAGTATITATMNGSYTATCDITVEDPAYCTPGPTSVDGSGITNVTFGTGTVVNDNLSMTSSPYYYDHSSQIGVAYPGATVEMSIAYATNYTYYTWVWVDWNRDYEFDDTELVYPSTETIYSGTLTIEFTVPATATLGNYRMRIQGADGSGKKNPCYTGSYSYLVDYTLRVEEVPTCLPPTGLDVVGAPTAHGVTVEWDATAGETFDYAIELGTGIDPTTVTYTGSITATTTTCSISWNNLTNGDSDYTVFIRKNCGNGDYSAPATKVIHTAVACHAPVDFTAVVNGTSVTLSWTGAQSDIAWSLNASANPDDYIDPDFDIDQAHGTATMSNMALDTDYYFWVRTNCGGIDGTSAWVGPLSVHIGYCVPSFGSNDDCITNITLGDINNTTASTSTDGYGLYTNLSTTLEAGEPATLSLTSGSGSGNHGAAVWIDFNDDMVFDDDDKVGAISDIGASSTVTIDLTILSDATVGSHRMRVVYQYSTVGGSISPCASATYGEAEDYTVVIVAPSNCQRPTNISVEALWETANLSWNGTSNSYTVRYRVAETQQFAEGSIFDDFENGLGNWTLIVNAEGTGWQTFDATAFQGGSNYSGNYVAMARSYENGEDITADNWMISSMFTSIPSTMTYWAKNDGRTDHLYDETYDVCVSTNTNDPSDFVIVQTFTTAPAEWDQITIDLSAYAGLQGYVAFHHHDAEKDMILIDDVFIGSMETVPAGEWQTKSTEGNETEIEIDGLTVNTTYEYQVKGFCDDSESEWTTISTFTTLSGCMTPNGLSAEITGNTAQLTWIGGSDTYNLHYREVDPTEPATIILTAGDVWEDGSGYQMLLDADATAYDDGVISDYSIFEYLIPTDAEYDYNTSAVVINNSVSIQIPAGTYDWFITNPSPGDAVYVAALNGNVGGSQDNYVFEAGKTYEFVPFLVSGSEGDGVNVTITATWTPVSDPVTSPYTFTLTPNTTYEWQVQGIDCDGNGTNTDWSESAYFTTPEFYTKHITGYDTSAGGYYLIASPIGEVDPEDVTNMTNDPYDLYYFDQEGDSNHNEWINYESQNGGGYDLVAGKGYLYANKYDVDLIFTGTAYSGNGKVALAYNEDCGGSGHFVGWNLVGNPFADTAYTDTNHDFYVMREDGAQIIPAENNKVEIMQGIFAIAASANDTITFSTTPINSGAKVVMNVIDNQGLADRAIVRFGEGSQLPKFQPFGNTTKVYFTEDEQDYAVVRSTNENELPVNFKASSNGTYTMSVNIEDVDMDYIHLIDNQTGMDIDLLQRTSYTFEATTSDSESRFLLVFSTVDGLNENNFGFVNAGGNLCIYGLDGKATVQVIDMLGHVLSSEQFSGSYEKHLNVAPGVYMIRLIQGNDIKVQKMVVR